MSKIIERAAVLAMKEFIARVDNAALIEENIPVNDKDIAYDGHLIIHETANQSSEDYKGQIGVQVKGKDMTGKPFDNILKYPVRVKDLNIYLAEDGVYFFVVALIFDENYNRINQQIYGRQLHNSFIRELLRKGNKHSITVEFYQLTKKNFYSSCVEYREHRNLQKVSLSSNVLLNDSKEMIIHTPDELVLDKNSGLPLNAFYTYQKFEVKNQEILLPGPLINMSKFMYSDFYDVSIEGEVRSFFIEIESTKHKRSIIFNKELILSYKLNSEEMRIKLKTIKAVNTYIDTLWLYKALLNSKTIEFGGNEIKFNNKGMGIRKELADFEVQLHKLKKYFNENGINNNQIGSTGSFTNDFSKVTAFNNSLEEGNLKRYNINKSMIYSVPIGSKYLLMYYNYEDNIIENIFQNKFISSMQAFIREEGKDVLINLSFIFGLTSDLMLDCLNYSHNFLISHLNEIEFIDSNTVDSQVAIKFTLELIKAYDLSKDKQFLHIALLVLEKINEGNDRIKLIKKVNIAQIYIRTNKPLNDDDILFLRNEKRIALEKQDYFTVLNICVVLNDSEADYYFDLINQEMKDQFIQYPIYTLFIDSSD